MLFQPIVSLPSGTVAGYEALGRGCHPRLPEPPLELFRVAAAVGAEAELSRLFRETALELVQDTERFSGAVRERASLRARDADASCPTWWSLREQGARSCG